MRLLHRNVDGSFELTKYQQWERPPEYAILSHTWLPDDEMEITFDDLTQGNTPSKAASLAKLQFCGEQAAKDGLEYFWVDTCCINKDSSAELSEAIIAMFSWYRNASRCYAYLTDVSTLQTQGGMNRGTSSHVWELAFRHSRWFTRGWTLQELIAPRSVEFFSREGVRLGDKLSLWLVIHEITGIPYETLRGDTLTNASVEQRFLWAENRQTKRPEDKAYCLLGIFGVFMPLIYGEGEGRALRRLRRKIGKKPAEATRLDQLLDRLIPVTDAAFNSRLNEHEPTCLPDTRVELLQDIKMWIDGKSPDDRCIFWLNGIAGTGKSTIARTVARTYYETGELGASFFFSRGGGESSNANKLFTTLARQLARRVPAAKEHICNAILKHEDVIEQSIRDQWEKLIIGPLSNAKFDPGRPTVLFVIDALDECNNERDILAIIRVLTNTARLLKTVHLRIFITSRPEISIRRSFRNIPDAERRIFVLHEISPTLVDRDLTIFFEEEFSIIREERDFEDDWPGIQIIKRLVEISCGLFIWASIACRFIKEGRRLAMRRINILIKDYRSSKGPKQQLDQIYTSILHNSIQQGYSKKEKEELHGMLQKVLGCIVTLCAPLSMKSLARLLGIPLRDIKDTLVDFHTIFNIPTEASQPIRLHHPTFRDFILDKKRCNDIEFRVDAKNAHESLTDSCLKIMSEMLKSNICNLQSPGTLMQDIDSDLVEQCIPPDLQYACLYWVEHYRQSGIRLSDNDRVHRFFNEYFLHWVEAINLMGKSAEMGAIIRLYHSLLAPPDNAHQVPFVKDARRLLFKFQNIIKQAPLQTYCTALASIPPTNELKSHFWRQLHPWLGEIRIAEADIPKPKDEFNYVSDLAFTPDGLKIASGSNFEAVRLWDVTTKAAICKYEGATDKMSSVAISPDGTTLAAGSDDFTVMAWDIRTGSLHYSIKAHSGWVNSVFFSPDGRMLASGSMDETVAIFDAVTGQEVRRIDNSSCVNSAIFSADGSLIATGPVDQIVRVWDVSKGSEEMCLMLDGHTGCVNCVRFAPNGKLIISGSDDMTIKIWDSGTGAEYITLEGHTKKVMAVGFSPDSRYVVSGSEDKTVRIWDPKSGTVLNVLQDHTSGINSVLFSPDGKILASSSFDDEVRLWDTETWSLRGKLEDFDEDANSGILATQRPYGSSALATPEYSTLSKGHSKRVARIVFSPDGQWLASGSEDATIKLWRDHVEHWTLKGHTGAINDLAISPGSHLLASCSSDRTLRLWNIASGVASYILEGHLESVISVIFSPNGRMVASSSTDLKTGLWDTASGRVMLMLEGHSDKITGLGFSPNDRFVASCSLDKTVLLWDTSSLSTPLTLNHSSPVNSVAFSHSSELVVSSSEDGTISIWTVSGASYKLIRGDSFAVNFAAFSPDDGLIVSCSANETMNIWDAHTRSLKYCLNAGIMVRRASFSKCGQYIETDRGSLKVASFSTNASSISHPYALFATREWLRRDMDNFLWLPQEFQATDVATLSDVVALGHLSDVVVLGHASGALSFINV